MMICPVCGTSPLAIEGVNYGTFWCRCRIFHVRTTGNDFRWQLFLRPYFGSIHGPYLLLVRDSLWLVRDGTYLVPQSETREVVSKWVDMIVAASVLDS